ncbi:hypothetical protein NW754_005659 [Fusarium falciforme]|uniref:Protein kinase domain-containing protein n=1 Tax=Fusarium falciforme TaxID=195108 RepID=A0A9W8UY81_9HYPO|nr:hypothetical protein NW754_005659 [Fusarium falciforme]KAJ4185179.1 hypothetical protein NW755_008623 [Fusarium falciforme]KAJ4240310.1 hypothetical protein NW757_012593 [Fusarium falciforme]
MFGTWGASGIIHVLQLNKTQPIYFARKELKAGRRGGGTPAFQREKHTLDMLNLVRHPHIVPLLASYIHHDRFNMIFPLADADLAAFLDGRSGVRIVDDALWQGVLGITSAIATLHDFRYTPVYGQTLENIGYHHDLKPRNILVKDSSFFLADFGLARLKATGEDSGTENKHGTATYGAPETQRQGSRIMFSRALDVWSWGCIILEILTFILLSSRGVHDFRSHRSTESGTGIDYYFHNMVEMKPEVEQWAGILRDKALSHDYRRKDLLIDVLGIAKAMLASDPASRPRASETLRKLQAIFAREGILQDAAEAVAQPNMTARTPAVLPESSVMAGNILENLADILDSDHPLMRAVRRSVNSDEQG